MSTDPRMRGRISPWIFLVGLVLFLGSIALFVFEVATGRDVLRAIAFNSLAAAVLMGWAAHDTLADPDSEVDSTGGAAGTSLLLYGVYLFVSGAVITITGFWHTRLSVGLWYLALALGATVVGYIIFPTEAIAASREEATDPDEAYERAEDTCERAAEDIADGYFERAREGYETIQTAVAEAVAADALTDEREIDEDETSTGDHTGRAEALVDSLCEQAETATEAGITYLEDDAYGDATEAFETAVAAIEAGDDIAAATDIEHNLTERVEQATAWRDVTEALSTADESSRTGGVAVALDALDKAEAAATDAQTELLDRKQGAILARVEATRRGTAIERLRSVADSVGEQSVLGAAESATALDAAADAADRLDSDSATHDQLREWTAQWTTVTALLTGGQHALEAGDHDGLLGLFEATLVALRVCEDGGITDANPGPRTVTAWLRACDRVMETYERAVDAVETAETQQRAGNVGAAQSAYVEARNALEQAQVVATDANIDTAAIDAELSTVTDELDTLEDGN